MSSPSADDSAPSGAPPPPAAAGAEKEDPPPPAACAPEKPPRPAAAAVSEGDGAHSYASIEEPSPEEDDDGHLVFPKKFTLYNWETISEEDIVVSVFPTKEVRGDIVQVKPATKRSDAFTSSVFDAEDKMEKILEPFGIQLETISSGAENQKVVLKKVDPELAKKLPVIKKHVRAIHGKTAKSQKMCYYCKRCLELKGLRLGDPDQIRMALVVVASLTDACRGEDDKAQAVLNILKLYPHDVACCGNNIQPRQFLDRDKGGSGVFIKSFPYDVIYQSTMNPLMKKIEEVLPQDECLPVGMQIYPQSYEKKRQMNYPFDNRRYEYLPSTDEWTRKFLSPVQFRYSTIQFWFWVACQFSLSGEMHDCQLVLKDDSGTGIDSKVYPTWPCPVSRADPHLRILASAGLWAGHEVGKEHEDDCPVDQIWHVDIREIEGDGGQQWTVHATPHPKGKFKPGIFVIPAQDYRDICFTQDCARVVVTVNKSELLYFSGDVAHGGKTYSGDDPSWHYSIHHYIDSKYHEMKDNTFGLVCEANALHGQAHAKHLSPDSVQSIKDVLNKAMEKIKKAEALRPSGSNKRKTY